MWCTREKLGYPVQPGEETFAPPGGRTLLVPSFDIDFRESTFTFAFIV